MFRELDHDPIGLNRIKILSLFLSMIFVWARSFFEHDPFGNRFPLFRIVL